MILRVGRKSCALQHPLGVAFSFFALCSAEAQTFRLERVASGLDKPVFVTQAPGDRRTLYVVEEFTDDVGGIGDRGRIQALDLPTGELTTFLTIPDVDRRAEGGLKGLAFHPDFALNGKFYVSWVESKEAAGTTFPNMRLDEFVVGENGPTLQRTLVDLPSIRDTAAHSINWIGFKPGAQEDERNQLYVAVGDGGYQAIDPSFVNLSQDLGSVFGKVLRIDVEADDAFPEDLAYNYGIPADNPYAIDDDPATRGDLFFTGFRNPWRASFDSANGDFYVGDVGNNTREEINFAKAGEAGIDFGWARREGSIPNPVAAQAGPQGDSYNPIADYDHDGTGFQSITGGVVYRGVVDELEGQYFFGDAVIGYIDSATFDRETDPALFDGNNLGTLSKWRFPFSEILTPLGMAINHPVSFGEDLSGNLYIVDHLDGGLFAPEFNTGEIYRIVPLAGDFDGDSDADATDLAQWEADYGIGPGSDATDDGFSDGADFLTWQRAFVPSAQVTQVPEPSTPIGIVGALLALTRKPIRRMGPVARPRFASR